MTETGPVATDLRCPPWTTEPGAVAAALGTDPTRGLTEAAAEDRLRAQGPNELPVDSSPTRGQVFVRQFTNTMTALLTAAAVVTILIGDLTDAVVITAIIVLNGIVGFVQDQRAEQAMAALRTLTTSTAQVVRSGEPRAVVTTDIVAGDVVVLTVGDIVPADLRLSDAHDLNVDESTLTGESEPVMKATEALLDPTLAVADRRNMAFRGTAVTAGRGSGIVVGTGAATELGKIASLLAGVANDQTPLQQRLDRLARQLATAAIGLCALMLVTGVLRGEALDDMILSAVTLAVAAVPEGLPAVVTIALALGARRMAARRAVVRHLPAVETLGSVSVIATDKTGTLTQNRMAVERVWTPAGSYRVAGTGYAPAGEVTGPTDPTRDDLLGATARVGAACNDAALHPPTTTGEDWWITGDPTEGALLAFASRAGIDPTAVEADSPRIGEVPFDAQRRRMITFHRDGIGTWVAAKGALDALEACLDPSDGDHLAEARAAADQLAGDGYRVLALAQGHLDARPPPGAESGDDLHLRLVGLVGIVDPPRPSAAEAVAACRRAGITPVMITGDHPKTALTIAERLGVLRGRGRVLTGAQVEALGADELARAVPDISVFARTDPTQKLRIVEAWQATGAIVAMTGDGVNDAPALRQADIGVAMGRTGTDVSREAADLVITDDDVATIVAAVEEGRRIHDNLRRVVRYLLSTNSGEVGLMVLAVVLGLPLPLLPLQILWINLITDGLPAIALGLEPVEAGAMQRGPRRPEASVLSSGLWQQSLGIGALLVAVTLPLLIATRAVDWPWQTMVFTTLGLAQIGTALALRSRSARRRPWLPAAVGTSAAMQLATIVTPAGRELFHTEWLDLGQLTVVAVLATVPFLVIETVQRLGVGARRTGLLNPTD